MISTQQEKKHSPIQGVGVGLRSPHYEYIEQKKPQMPWFEVLIDNYMCKGGDPLFHLRKIRKDYPVTFHGVGMSIGSTDPLNMEYLKKLKHLIEEFEPGYISDHLCWSSINGRYLHDLLPLPYIEEVAFHVVDRIKRVQDFLGCRILIENVSSYLTYKVSVAEEWEFIKLIAESADCDILLDINNIYVSASNHHFEASEYLKNIPKDRVKEFHLAGYENTGSLLIDTHGEEIHPPVWKLYEQALTIFGDIPTLIEWDNKIPQFELLQSEANKAVEYMNEAQDAAA